LIVTSSSNPYTTYLPEIVRTEGFNEFDTADISTVTSTTLSPYGLVLLGDMSLTAAQASTFISWVNGGGNLIAMHPDPQLAGLLGLVDTGTALSNAYIAMNTASGPGVGLVGQTIQFHGPAELYTVNGATSYATLYSNAGTPTSNPAVTLNLVGAGQAAAFTYDLARSVTYTRQGNPAWSGEARDAANTPPIRAYNLFFGAASFDPEPNWIDFNKVAIPQADEQQRLLANLMLQMNMGKIPLPHFWYFPSGVKAVVIMTGDDHGSYYGGSATASRFADFIAASPSGCSVANWQCVRGTAYLFPNIVATTTLTNAQVAAYVAQGFEIAAHVDSASDCQDWTTSELNSDYSNFLASFASEFPSLPAPQTHRMHCISWSDYDSQPTVELSYGIRLDTTYYYWPSSWINNEPGMFTGSGMPMRYTDRNGNLINVYQATTQMTDESGQTYPYNIDTLLDNAVGGSGYYGVFTANMHNDVGSATYGYPGPGASYIVSSAQSLGVPIVTALQMLQWLDGRNGSSFGSLAWSGNVLSFTITVGTNANNLRAMLPVNFGSLGLSSLTLSGSPVSYQLQTIKGVQYAMFAASAGNYQATYGGPPLFSISGNVSGPGGTTVTATGPITASATPDSYGNYALNGLPNGTYTVTPSQSGLSFTPSSQVVTLSGVNVTGVSFGALQICPCSLWSSSVVPGTVAANDPNAVELGVRFSSDVPGSITGIRFYKGSTNTGTHVGNLWTNTGTLLASATFSNETASGWQQVNFTNPVTIAANTVYVASYHTNAGNYAADDGYFGSAYNNLPLQALQDESSSGGLGNGTYVYGSSAFPNNTYASTNYYVDVVFTTTAATGTALSSVALNPTSVTGGSSSTGTVTLSGAAPAGGAVVTLSSNNAAATAPASVTVAAGATTATFTVTTTAVASAASAIISATLNSGTQTATLAVNPPVISSVTLNPASVSGGTSSTGTVTLSGVAPTGGGSVSLSSNNAAATVPASVTVAAGATTATFTVTTTAVTSSTSVTISATFNGTQTATLTVNPSGSTFSISGTISGSGGNGATVALSGTSSATVTASSTGTYSFSNLANGSYTVTPSHSGYIFTPASQAVTVSGANATANFTSTAQLTIDQTVSTDRSTSSTTITSPTFTTTKANELLLAFIATDAKTAGVTVSAVANATGGTLTWTLVRRTNTQLGTAEIWRAFSTTTLSGASVKATLSQSVAASITVVTLAGVDTTGTGGSGAIGATGSGNANPGAPTASLTTTRNNSWVVGVGDDWDNAISRTVGPNQTMVHQYLATVEDTYWVQRQNSTTPTSGTVVTINDTAPTGDRYNLTIVEVLPAQ